MIFLIGVATGGIISGMLSDKFGRKKMLFISAVFQSFFGKYFRQPFRLDDLNSLRQQVSLYTSLSPSRFI